MTCIKQFKNILNENNFTDQEASINLSKSPKVFPPLNGVNPVLSRESLKHIVNCAGTALDALMHGNELADQKPQK